MKAASEGSTASEQTLPCGCVTRNEKPTPVGGASLRNIGNKKPSTPKHTRKSRNDRPTEGVSSHSLR